jgi:hypothetical protein
VTEHLTPGIPTTADVQRLVAAELSRSSRVGHVALLLVALVTVLATASLWLTEAGLPLRTHIAFAGLTAIGLSWVGYAWWVLFTRQLVFDIHRVVAARMALGFSAAFVAASFALAMFAPADSGRFGQAAWAAGGCGVVMCVAALVLLRRAQRRVAALRSRRSALEAHTQGLT